MADRRLAVSAATNRLGLGDKIRLIPRPLRPDRQPLRLVCLCPRQPRRAALADHCPRSGALMLIDWPSRGIQVVREFAFDFRRVK
jgi:hypothetical protein